GAPDCLARHSSARHGHWWIGLGASSRERPTRASLTDSQCFPRDLKLVHLATQRPLDYSPILRGAPSRCCGPPCRKDVRSSSSSLSHPLQGHVPAISCSRRTSLTDRSPPRLTARSQSSA